MSLKKTKNISFTPPCYYHVNNLSLSSSSLLTATTLRNRVNRKKDLVLSSDDALIASLTDSSNREAGTSRISHALQPSGTVSSGSHVYIDGGMNNVINLSKDVTSKKSLGDSCRDSLLDKHAISSPSTIQSLPSELFLNRRNIKALKPEEVAYYEFLLEAEECFTFYDINGKGFVPVAEFCHMARNLGQIWDINELKALQLEMEFKQVEAYDAHLFVQLLNRKYGVKVDETALKDAFDVFDRMRKQHVETSDLKHFMTAFCDKLTKDEYDLLEKLVFGEKDAPKLMDFATFLKFVSPMR